MTIYFELKQTAPTTHKIIVKISHLTNRTSFSTGQNILPKNWDEINRQPKSIPSNNGINQYVNNIKTVFNKYINEVLNNNETLNVFDCKNYLLNNIQTNSKTVDGAVMDNLIAQFLESKMSDNKRQKIEFLRKHLHSYDPKLKVNAINQPWIEKFSHSEINKGKQTGILNQYIVYIKNILKWGHSKKIVTSDKFTAIKLYKIEPSHPIALNESELTIYENCDFAGHVKRELARDWLLFSCYTGLRWGDLCRINKGTVINNRLVMFTQKTKSKMDIQLPPPAVKILEKHNGVLPELSQKMINMHIKGGLKWAGIDRQCSYVLNYITSNIVEYDALFRLASIHMGRSTFTSILLSKGIPLTTVMSLTTHTDYRSFKKYWQKDINKLDDVLSSVFK
jgi:integrase